MDKIGLISEIIQMFYFKTISDTHGNEYVIFSNSTLDSAENIEDKTMFESVENHIHILDNVKKRDVKTIDDIGEKIGRLLLDRLKFCYPQKKFYVFVTYELNDSLIIRFHQDWSGEEPYYDPTDYLKTEKDFYFKDNTYITCQKGLSRSVTVPCFLYIDLRMFYYFYRTRK